MTGKKAPTEATPLIENPSSISLESKYQINDIEERLDFTQIGILTFCRLADPVCCMSVFAFVSNQLHELGVPTEDVGFYAGLIESLFSFVELFVMLPWAKLSDRIGRKPVLVMTLFGLFVTQTLFGLATTPMQMIVLRCLAGAFAGVLCTLRVLYSENSNEHTKAQAFAYYSFGNTMGNFSGPLLGGLLADPASQYPKLFGHFKILIAYPYLLPCFASGCVALVGCVLALLFLKETLRPGSRAAKATRKVSVTAILQSPGVVTMLVLAGLHNISSYAVTVVTPIAYFTPINLGGFSFSPSQISYYLALNGVSSSIWMLFVFPSIHKRLGSRKTMHLASLARPCLLLINPIANMLLKHHQIGAFYGLTLSGVVLMATAVMLGPSVQLSVNNVCPGPEAFATLTAFQQTIMSLLRTAVPGVFASLYAYSVRNQIWNGYIIWPILSFTAATLTLGMYWFPENAEDPSHIKAKDES